MNTTKTVYNKLFKEESTELAAHEVELATMADLLKAYINSVKIEKESADAYLIFKTDLARVKQKIQDNMNVNVITLEQFAVFEKSAKALGLSLPPDVQKNKDTVNKGMANYNRYLKNLNSIKL